MTIRAVLGLFVLPFEKGRKHLLCSPEGNRSCCGGGGGSEAVGHNMPWWQHSSARLHSSSFCTRDHVILTAARRRLAGRAGQAPGEGAVRCTPASRDTCLLIRKRAPRDRSILPLP